MSQLSLKSALLSILLLCYSPNVKAALYGFDTANPYTVEEQILDIDVPPAVIVNYREKMRDNVNMLANFAKGKNPDFKIIVHDSDELFEKALWEYDLEGYNDARRNKTNAPDPSFLSNPRTFKTDPKSADLSTKLYNQNIDGIVLNNLLCRDYPLNPHLKNSSLRIISIDKCSGSEELTDAMIESVGEKILLYGFTNQDMAFKLAHNSPIINENADNIFTLDDARNIVFVTDDARYKTKQNMIDDIRNSNYDIIILSPLFHNQEPFTADEVHSLKFKKNGTKRLIFAEQNLSEAKPGTYYWKKNWKVGTPGWLVRKSLVSENNIITQYWHEAWKKIIARYFKSIVESGYDGVFFTGLQNYRYFEKLTPLD